MIKLLGPFMRLCRFLPAAIVLMPLVVLVGCANLAQPTKLEPVSLLLKPETLGRNLSLSQIVIGTYAKRTVKMRFEVEVTAQNIVVVGLSSLGVTLFTLEYDGGEPSIQVFVKDKVAYNPSFILFDLYAAYWPPQVLKSAFAAQGMIFQESPDHKTRVILNKWGEKLVQVTYRVNVGSQSDADIHHFDVPYQLTIKTLRIGPAQ